MFVERKVAVFRRPATWGDGGPMSKTISSCQLGDGDFKGSVKEGAAGHVITSKHDPQIVAGIRQSPSITSLHACGQFSFVEFCFLIPVKTA